LFSFALKGDKSEVEMTLRELWTAIAKNPRGSEPSNRALVDLNQRFALPVGAVLLCLMAMPLGLSPLRHGRLWGLVLAWWYFGVLCGLHRVLAPGR
jgi:lipopolysaccharide export LptBFGC system permease protein LptF